MLNTRRKERNQIRPHVLKIVFDGYGWGVATKIIENTFKVSLSNAIKGHWFSFWNYCWEIRTFWFNTIKGPHLFGSQRNIMKAEQHNNYVYIKWWLNFSKRIQFFSVLIFWIISYSQVILHNERLNKFSISVRKVF